MKELDLFLASSDRNRWLFEDKIKVYVRKSTRIINKELRCKCLDIASIEVEPGYYNHGIFTDFMTQLLKEYPNLNIYVENICNPAVTHVLKKFDFKFKNDVSPMWSGIYQHDMYLIQDVENNFDISNILCIFDL